MRQPDDHYRLCRAAKRYFQISIYFLISIAAQLEIESQRKSNQHESTHVLTNTAGLECKRSISIQRNFKGFFCMLVIRIILHPRTKTSIKMLANHELPLTRVVFVVLLANGCIHFLFSVCRWTFISCPSI